LVWEHASGFKNVPNNVGGSLGYPAWWLADKEVGYTKKFTTPITPTCISPDYKWDECKNELGCNQCKNDCECDGQRNCS